MTMKIAARALTALMILLAVRSFFASRERPKTQAEQQTEQAQFCAREDEHLRHKLLNGEAYTADDEHFLIECHPDSVTDVDKYIDKLRSNNP
jgi:hypothetical protein